MPSAMTSSTYEWRRQAWASAQTDAKWECEWGSLESDNSYAHRQSAWKGADWNNRYESSCKTMSHLPSGYAAVLLSPGQYRPLIGHVVVGCTASQEGQYLKTCTAAPSQASSAKLAPMVAPARAQQSLHQASSAKLAPVDGDCHKPQHDKEAASAATPLLSVAPAPLDEDHDDKPQPDQVASGVDREQAVSTDELPSIGSAGHADGSCKRCAFFPKGRCLNGKDCTHCHFDHVLRRRFRKQQQKQLQLAQEALGQTALAAGESLEELQAQQKDPETSYDEPHFNASCESLGSSALDSASEVPYTPEASDEELSVSAGLERRLTTREQQVAVTSATCVEVASNHDDKAETETTASSAPPLSDPEETPASTSPDASDCEESERSVGIKKFEADGALPCETESPSTLKLPTSWAAQQRMRRAAALSSNSSEVLPAEIARRARALLNKLTEDRFESLCGQVLSLPLSTPEQLAAVAHEIFEKATTQQFFRQLYTELCLRLDSHLADREGPIGGKSFRKTLVNECQASFERHAQPLDSAALKDLSEEDQFEAEMKLKNCRLGNMRFIGELFARRLLALKVMPPILHELFEMDSNAALESVTALLSVVGPVFDSEKVSPLHRAPLLDAFALLHRKSTDKAVLLRVRCQIRDLLDARARGWTSRHAER